MIMQHVLGSLVWLLDLLDMNTAIELKTITEVVYENTYKGKLQSASRYHMKIKYRESLPMC
jgi:hypothetical protein